jgi:hypothetical protein
MFLNLLFRTNIDSDVFLNNYNYCLDLVKNNIPINFKLIRLNSTLENGTFGRLYCNNKILCNTIEPPDLENIPNISNIPVGIYKLKKHFWNKKKSFVTILENVPNRSGILIHSGQNKDDTQGCIIPFIEENKKRNSKEIAIQINKLIFFAITKNLQPEIEVQNYSQQQKNIYITLFILFLISLFYAIVQFNKRNKKQ